MKLFTSILIACAAVMARPTNGPYEGHSVLRFDVTNKDQLDILHQLVENLDLGLDAWTSLHIGQVDIRVPPRSVSIVNEKTKDIPSSIWIPNVQGLIDEESVNSAQVGELTRQNLADPATFFKDYRSADEYMAFLLEQPGTTEFRIGTTFEKRPIRGVKFGTGKRTIFYNGGIHAREWISPATTTYITNFLLSQDPRAVRMREQFTFHVVPVLNPDGYEYSRKSDRMWRKNREPTSNARCAGVDINRNVSSKSL
jgi:hypothetical protein